MGRSDWSRQKKLALCPLGAGGGHPRGCRKLGDVGGKCAMDGLQRGLIIALGTFGREVSGT